MVKRFFATFLAIAALTAAACGGRTSGGPGGATVMLPPIEGDLAVYATLPKDAIGEELPAEGIGSLKSIAWKAVLGGFTEERFSQSLGFEPGTKLTIRNLSSRIEHTLDVVKVISGPPADFPQNPKLSIPPRGGNELEAGYASGPIKPGKSATVILAKAGVYLIGCAFHYGSGMHDVLVVAPHATPGPQATPPPRSTPTPHSHSSYAP